MGSSGAIADLLLDAPQKTSRFSVFTIAAFVTRGDPHPPLGLVIVQYIFVIFTLVIPMLSILVLLVLLLAKLGRNTQKTLLKFCHIMDCWSTFDVFALAVLVGSFEFSLLAKFLVYNDNLARVCNWIHDELKTECLGLDLDLTPGFFVLAIGAVASYAVPKAVCSFCRQTLEGVCDTSDSLLCGLGSSSSGEEEEEGSD